ncbi:g8719 [Coccomyxa elongata]
MLASGAQHGLRMQPNLRSFSTAVAANAVPALSEATTSSAGWLSKLFGGSSRLTVPMTDPLPGIELPAPTPPPAKAPTTETTTLPNGVTIASEQTLGPTATLGLYVNSGSVYESPSETGLSHLLEYMAFKTTSNRTHFRLVREVESIGANVLASASREQMAYNIDVVKTNVPEALEILVDSVVNPKFVSWEVNAAINKMREDIKTVKDNPQTVLLEGMHEVAYTGGLARPLIVPESALGALSAGKLADFVARNYTAPRIALAGAGVAQDELVSLAQPLLEFLPKTGAEPQPKSTYVGGDFRQVGTDLTHAMLAFEFSGGWNDMKGSVAVTVLQFLLGGGGSFSAGGPGKGMHSRLYRRVLNANEWVHNCTAFNSLYNDTGLVGIFISGDCQGNAQRSAKMIDILTTELQAVAKGVPAEELERAKLAAISSVYMNLESRAVVAEDIGRQILTYGHRKPVPEFVKAIKELTPDSLAKIVAKILKTPPTVASLGDISNLPRYDAIAARFR